MMKNTVKRCSWVSNDPLYQRYHDEEWGVPEFDSVKLFELLCLEGQQAGLSWITVLKRRQEYRSVFFQFDPKKIVTLSEEDIEQLMQSSNIIKHRKKIHSIVQNANAYLRLSDQGVSFGEWVWELIGGRPVVNHWPDASLVPVMTQESKTMSIALKRHGFTFVGPTICYAFMQAAGMVFDHAGACYLAK